MRLFPIAFWGADSLVPSGLLARYAANDTYSDTGCTTPITTDATAVRGWKDKTGNGLHATQAGASGICPRWRSGGYIEFNGVNQYLDLATGINCTSQNATIAIVMQFGSVGSNQDVVDVGSNLLIPRLRSGQINAWKIPNNHPTGIIPVTNTTYVWHSASGASGFEASVNGISFTTSLAADNYTSAGGTIGKSGGSNYFNGRIYEILIYSGTLTAAQVRQNERYFAAAYGAVLSTPTTILVFKGDSLTQASLNTTMYDSYPAQVMRNRSLNAITAYNLGVSSQTVASMITNGASEVDSKFVSGYTNIYGFWGGTNDLVLGASAATVCARIATWDSDRQSAGANGVIGTILPRSDVSAPVDFESNRLTVNDYIRSTFAGRVADVAGDSRIGDAGDELDTTYYLTDKVHLNDTGLAIAGSIFSTAVNGLL